MVPSMYRLKYEIKGEPLISILIPNKDHVSDLRKCIVSIQEKTSYPNYEIIVIENNSEEEKTFQYYQLLEKRRNIRKSIGTENSTILQSTILGIRLPRANISSC